MTQRRPDKDRYHHGNLPETLIRKGAELLAEQGIEGFSLRLLAKRSGVTVGAPSHHFGSVRGLLTAIATAGFYKLANEMQRMASVAPDGEEAVVSVCRAYLDMRATNPGYASVMFRLDRLDEQDEAFRSGAYYAFGYLKRVLGNTVPETVEENELSNAAKALWATAQGITTLPMIDDQEADRLIRISVSAHLRALR